MPQDDAAAQNRWSANARVPSLTCAIPRTPPQDADMLVLNKWAGLNVQGAASSLAQRLHVLKLSPQDEPR